MDPDRTLDLTDLDPPEPLTRMLDELEDLPPGTRLRALFPMDPELLYAILEQDDFRWDRQPRDDGTVLLVIWRGGT